MPLDKDQKAEIDAQRAEARATRRRSGVGRSQAGEDGLVQVSVGGEAAVDGGVVISLAGTVGEAAAGVLEDGDDRADVPWVEFGFDDGVDPAGGKQQ